MRGDGIRFPTPEDAGHWHGTSATEIQKQADALKVALPLTETSERAKPVEDQLTLRKKASAWWHDNQWWLGPITIVAVLALPFLL